MGVVFDPLLGRLRTSDASGSATLTANSTATSGFTAGQLLMSDGTKLQAGTNVKATSLALGGAAHVNALDIIGAAAISGTLVAGGTALQSGGGLTINASIGITNHAWSIDTNGILWGNIATASLSSSNYALFPSGGSLNVNAASGRVIFSIGNTNYASVFSGGVGVQGATGAIFWTDSSNPTSTSVVHLLRDANQTLGMRNPATTASPQTFNVYNSADGGFSPPTNSEYGSINWVDTSNVFTIATKAQGTGTARDIAIIPASGANVRFGAVAANVAVTVAGTIAIKDAGGTLRYLMYTNTP